MITREEAFRVAHAMRKMGSQAMREYSITQLAEAIEKAANEDPWDNAVNEWMLDGRELRASATPLFELLYHCYVLLEPNTHSTPKFTTPTPELIQSLRNVLKLEP